MSEFTTLAGTREAVWARLEAGARDRDAPARHPVLATCGEVGAAARVMVLHGVSREAATYQVQSGAAAVKVAEPAALRARRC